MILLIKHRVDWEIICKKSQVKINRDNNRENEYRVDYDYKVGDDAILTKKTAYKNETPYKGPYYDNMVLDQYHGLIKNWSHIN